MTLVDFFTQVIWPPLRKFGAWCFQKLCQYRWQVITVLLSVFFLPLLWSYYRAPFEQEITVLVGAPGSSSERLGSRLAREIRDTPNQFGLNYRVRTEATDGIEEIRRRLENDSSGTYVGFQIDSQADTQALRTIYPMDFDYLHVLCSRRFLEQHPGQDPEMIYDLHRVFTIIHELMQQDSNKVAGRSFLGSVDGTSRVVAKELFKLYNLDATNLAHPSIDDWNEARVGLLMGQLDLVFMLSPKNADMVATIAEDHSAVLLDLGLGEALADKTEYSLWPGYFPEKSYTAAEIPWKPAQPGEQTGLAAMPAGLKFCKDKSRTIVARRLLASSAAMNEHDAYAIMGAAERTFAGSGPSVGEWSSTSPPTSGPVRNSLGIREHKVARLFRDKQKPQYWFWPTTWSSSFLTTTMAIVLFIVTQIFGPKSKQAEKEPTPDDRVEGSIAKQQVGEGQPAPAVATASVPVESPAETSKKPGSMVFDRLQGDINMTREVIQNWGPTFTADDRRFVQRRIEEFRKELGFLRGRVLTVEEATHLSDQIKALDLLCPAPSTKKPDTVTTD